MEKYVLSDQGDCLVTAKRIGRTIKHCIREELVSRAISQKKIAYMGRGVFCFFYRYIGLAPDEVFFIPNVKVYSKIPAGA